MSIGPSSVARRARRPPRPAAESDTSPVQGEDALRRRTAEVERRHARRPRASSRPAVAAPMPLRAARHEGDPAGESMIVGSGQARLAYTCARWVSTRAPSTRSARAGRTSSARRRVLALSALTLDAAARRGDLLRRRPGDARDAPPPGRDRTGRRSDAARGEPRACGRARPGVPDDAILEIYTALRPGRSRPDELEAWAQRLENPAEHRGSRPSSARPHEAYEARGLFARSTRRAATPRAAQRRGPEGTSTRRPWYRRRPRSAWWHWPARWHPEPTLVVENGPGRRAGRAGGRRVRRHRPVHRRATASISRWRPRR